MDSDARIDARMVTRGYRSADSDPQIDVYKRQIEVSVLSVDFGHCNHPGKGSLICKLPDVFSS